MTPLDLGYNISDSDLDAVVELLDTNDSGYLDFSEILKWYCGQQ
jgi:Ca2+-binding EF-hand superfamily protein